MNNHTERPKFRGQSHTPESVLLAAQLRDTDGRHDFSDIRPCLDNGEDAFESVRPAFRRYQLYSSTYNMWFGPYMATRIRAGRGALGLTLGVRNHLDKLNHWGFTIHHTIDEMASLKCYSVTCKHGVTGVAQKSSLSQGKHPTYCPHCMSAVKPGVASAVIKHATADPDHPSHKKPSWLVVIRGTDKTGNTFYKIGKANDIEKRYGWADEVLYSTSMTEYSAYKEEQKALDFLRDTGVRLGMSAELFPKDAGGRTETFRSKRGLHLLLAHLKCCL